jgi:hypothetical protein
MLNELKIKKGFSLRDMSELINVIKTTYYLGSEKKRQLKIDTHFDRVMQRVVSACPVEVTAVCKNVRCKKAQPLDAEFCGVCGERMQNVNKVFDDIPSFIIQSSVHQAPFEEQAIIRVSSYLRLFYKNKDFRDAINNVDVASENASHGLFVRLAQNRLLT